MEFTDLGFSPDVLRAITEAGYTTPTPIQEQAIPIVLQGRDVLGCAQTGTGKTASFVLPMIEILAAGRARARMPRSLILEPTRELAAQVAQNFEIYGRFHRLNTALLVGGESMNDQRQKLERGVHVLIATPGRLMDLFDRGNILLSDIKILVLDECDRMLDMGFIPDIERIVSMLPKMRQTLMFSATLPPEIRRLADTFLMNPKEVTVAPPASTAALVTQAFSVVWPEDKRKALRYWLQTEDVKNALVFCNRKRDVALVHQSLLRHGFNVGALHGDLPQSKRTETLDAFKKDEIAIMVCSDVAARGLDIQGLSHVFNFDVPIHAEDYVHRIGRTGRAGKSGRAFTLAAPEDGKFVAAISKLIGRDIPQIAIAGFESPELLFDAEDIKRRRRKSKSEDKPGGRPERASRAGSKRGKEPPRREETPRPEPTAVSSSPPVRQPKEPAPLRPEAARPPVGRPPVRPRPHREFDDGGEMVIGFGEHIPAFLMQRPSRRAE